MESVAFRSLALRPVFLPRKAGKCRRWSDSRSPPKIPPNRIARALWQRLCRLPLFEMRPGKHNRIFHHQKFVFRALLKASLVNVSETGWHWNAVYGLQVQGDLLAKYTVPCDADDYEGYTFVGALVREIDAALESEVPSRLVSYGKYLGIEFSITAQRRRDSVIEVLTLRALLGPCDANQLVGYVTRLGPPI